MGKRRRRCSSGEDRISGLPDDLLHAILVRLQCARAAARTSVLSRRWRHVWQRVPKLFLDTDTVDDALAGYSAPTLEGLRIYMSPADPRLRIPAERVTPWLRFAAEHKVGILYLSMPVGLGIVDPEPEVEEVVLELPVLQWAKIIHINLEDSCQFRLTQNSFAASMIQRFDEVDELKLEVSISEGVAGYVRFLDETNKLPKCKTFMISLAWGRHALLPSMLHLFRSCNSTNKCSVDLLNRWDQPPNVYFCLSFCPCGSEKRRNIDGIALSSLEELEIGGFTDCLELVEFICCSATILKRLVINYATFPAPPLTKEVCEKVRSMCHPNVEVEFYVYHDRKRVRFD